MSSKYTWMVVRRTTHHLLLLTMTSALIIQTVQLELVDRNKSMKLLIFRPTIELTAVLDFQACCLLQVLLTSVIHTLCIMILSLNLVVQLTYTVLI